MTNMPEKADFKNFTITIIAISIPFFSIIGFLSTKYGYSIWVQKTKELWHFFHPKRGRREKVQDDENALSPRGPVNRTLSTEEGMRARLGGRAEMQRRRSSHRPPPSHPNIQRMVQRMGEGRQSGLTRMGTLVDDDDDEEPEKVAPGIKRGETVVEIRDP
jgi:hypothetical protein